jgi:hypothetical protein
LAEEIGYFLPAEKASYPLKVGIFFAPATLYSGKNNFFG